MTYSVDGQLIAVYGGRRSDGSLSNEMFRLQALYRPGNWAWSTPPSRNFSGAAPPMAGMRLIALGEGRGHITPTMESFTASGYSSQSGCNGTVFGSWQTTTTPTASSQRPLADYPNLYQLPDGRLFNAGPAPGADLVQNKYKRFFNLQSAQWEEASAGDNQDLAYFGSSVMYRPGKILRAGSVSTTGHGTTQTIDVGAGQQSPWAPYVEDLTHPALLQRAHSNLTVLPTGDVLATGGVSDDDHIVDSNNNPLSTDQKRPQLWRVSQNRWTSTVAADQEQLAFDSQIRNYHSTAILLPDARVLTTGGEKPSPDETTCSVFEPPYLFRSTGSDYAPRPHIQLAPSALSYSHSFTIALTDPTRAATIKSVALIRPGAVTHGFDQGQRYVPLEYQAADNPSRLLVKAPANAFLAAPSDQMIFVVDSVATDAPRVPSIAYWTRIGAPTSQPDPADVTAPAGGSYSSMSFLMNCDVTSLHPSWRAPADDDAIAFSGPATSYDLRYTTDVNGNPPFSSWTVVTGLPTPGACFSFNDKVVTGLSDAQWYRFGVTTTDDNQNTSVLSSTIVGRPASCDGDGGGEGIILHSQSPTPLEPSLMVSVPAAGGAGDGDILFPGAALDSLTSDALWLEGAPEVQSGARLLHVCTGGTRGLSLDRVRLLAVDHAAGTEAAAATDGRFLAGIRTPLTGASDAYGADLTQRLTGGWAEPLYADSGMVVDLTLPSPDSTGDILLLETSAGRASKSGLCVEALDGAGAWAELARMHPRRHQSTHAVPLAGHSSVRLRFTASCVVHFAGRLIQLFPASVSTGQIRTASVSGADCLDAARARDGVKVVVPALDTLALSFDEPTATATGQRSWCVFLEGAPIASSAAAFLRSQPANGAAVPPRFALLQNVPNPFRNSTTIGFELPASENAVLDIFDTQGRRIRRFEVREGLGRHLIDWDMRDGRGDLVAPGIYTYRLTAGRDEARRKMVVLP